MGSTGLVETTSPHLLRAVHELAEKYDSHYTIHLNQSRLEVESLMLMRGVRPTESLFHNDYLGPPGSWPPTSDSSPHQKSPFLAQPAPNISHQPAMAARRARHSPHSRPPSRWLHHRHGHRQQHPGHGRSDADGPLHRGVFCVTTA